MAAVENNIPSGEKILSLLIDLYADQCNVKVKYHINTKEEGNIADEKTKDK